MSSHGAEAESDLPDLDSADRDRMLRERDRLRLTRWNVRAGTCTTVAELFDEP